MPVLHLPQLVGLALGLDAKELGLTKHVVKPTLGDRLVDLGGRRRSSDGSAAGSAQPRAAGGTSRRSRRALRLARRRRRRAAPPGTRPTRCRHRRETRPGLRAARRVRPGGGRTSCARPRRSRRRRSLGQRGRAADQRRPHLPLLPGDDSPALEKTLCMLTYAYWRGDIAARGRRRAVRARERRRRVQRDHRRHGRRADAQRRVRARWSTAACASRASAPPKPYAWRRLDNRTHAQDPRRRRLRRARPAASGSRERVDRRRRGPRPLARHPRARCAAADRARAVRRRSRSNWLEATGEVLVGDGYAPRAGASGAAAGRCRSVRSSAGVGDTNVEALVTVLAIAAARESLDLTAGLLRAAPGVHRRARGRRRARRAACACSCPASTSIEPRSRRRRARELRRAARGRRRARRVRPDDAAREGARARRRCSRWLGATAT